MGVGLRFGLGPLRFYIPIVRGGQRRRPGRGRRPAPAWTHPGCSTRHRTQQAAQQCSRGLTPTAVPGRRPPRQPVTQWTAAGSYTDPMQGGAVARPDDEALEAARSALLGFVQGDAEPADRVQRQREAEALGQRYFDLAIKSFMVVANQGLERAKKEGASSAIFAATEAHLDHVHALASEVGGTSHGIGASVSLVDEIVETRRRLEGSLEHARPQKGLS